MDDFVVLQDAIYDKIQQARQSKGQVELFPYEDLGSREEFIARRSASLELTVPEDKVDDFSDFVASEFQARLDDENHENAISLVLERAATHFGIFVKRNDQTFVVQITVFYYYLDVDPIGPVIDGDVVVQGVIADDRYLPCMCTLEVENDGDFMEVVTVPPTRMMINTGNEGDDMDSVGKIMIPLTVPDEHIDKLFRVRVYVREKLSVSLEEDVPDFDSLENRKDMILAIESVPNAPNSVSVEGMEGLLDMSPEDIEKARTEDADDEDADTKRPEMTEEEKEIADMEEKLLQSGQVLEDDEDFGQNVGDGDNSNGPATEQPVLHEIHIAFDYDELIALQSEGHQLICTHVTPDGPISDQEQLWKYHVLGKFGSPSEPGIEDLVFVKCLKSMGTLPVVPFYKIMHDYDLSGPEDSYAVYLAVKMGPAPRFQQMVMLSANYEDEDLLQKYVTATGGIYRPSPEEIERVFRGRCGLLFISGASSNAKGKKHPKAVAATANTQDIAEPAQTGSRGGDGDGSSNNQRGDDDEEDEEDEEEEEEDEGDDEEAIATLRIQIERVENEKLSLQSMNADLQKRAVLLMQREKALQGQATGAAAARAAETAATPSGGGAANAAGASGAGGVGEGELNYEQTLEKEKQYQDVLRIIVEARNKLEKQLRDFEQLAVDLQTRLDDKEFNAKSIATSFKQFKKEILLKSENSRTGHHIAKPQIEAIEGAELKREEDLEKVRLRNIGLRNLQKKLENTLRSREKLADDLHYIDFEQLKIENQTLNEKIEERNEELAKLKRKKTTTVQVLTHIREKLRFTENSNRVLREKVNSIDQVITKLRNIVTSYKLERDSIRLENKELRAKQGFATSDLLLMDYENQKQQSDVLIAEITELKNRYEILNRQAKLGMSMSGSNAFDPAGGSSVSGGKLGNKWTTSG